MGHTESIIVAIQAVVFNLCYISRKTTASGRMPLLSPNTVLKNLLGPKLFSSQYFFNVIKYTPLCFSGSRTAFAAPINQA